MKKIKNVMYIILYFIVFSFVSCASNRPLATTSHERIEERLKPIPISADTIEITLHSRDAACCVRSPQRSKNNVTSVEIQRALLTKSNSESLNPNQRSLNRRRKNGKKSFQSVESVGEKNNSEGVKSVDRRPLTVDNIKSTRGISMQTTHTDSSMRIKLTLRPDTIYVPYTTHIRSDTIIAPDPTTKAKLTTARWQIAILILIIIIIVGYRLWSTVNNQ